MPGPGSPHTPFARPPGRPPGHRQRQDTVQTARLRPGKRCARREKPPCRPPPALPAPGRGHPPPRRSCPQASLPQPGWKASFSGTPLPGVRPLPVCPPSISSRKGGRYSTLASFRSFSTSSATSATLFPPARSLGEARERRRTFGAVSTPRESAGMTFISFFLAFMMPGSEA